MGTGRDLADMIIGKVIDKISKIFGLVDHEYFVDLCEHLWKKVRKPCSSEINQKKKVSL